MKLSFKFLVFLWLILVFGGIFASKALASPVTVGAYSESNIRFTGTSVKLRVFVNQTFTTAETPPKIIYQSGVSATGPAFAESNCTISTNTLSCAALTLQTTTDSPDYPDARYTAVIYANNVLKLTILDNFYIPSTIGSTSTWADLRIINKSVPLNLPYPTFLNAAQTLELILHRGTDDDINLTGLNSSINWANGGEAPPSASDATGGSGTKLLFYNAAAPNYVAQGIENNALWFNFSAPNCLKTYFMASSSNVHSLCRDRFQFKNEIPSYTIDYQTTQPTNTAFIFKTNATVFRWNFDETNDYSLDLNRGSLKPFTAGMIDLGSFTNPFGRAFVQRNNGLIFSDGVSAGARIASGPGVPLAADADGSIWLRTDGTAATTFYVRQGAVWKPIDLTLAGGTISSSQIPNAQGNVQGPYTDLQVTHIQDKAFGNFDYDEGEFPCWDESTSQFVKCAQTSGLPSQTGQSGKFLKTNGTSESWNLIAQSDVTNLTSDLSTINSAIASLGATKANSNNAALTGDPIAPTAAPGDNDTSVATTGFVNTALSGFSGGATGSAGGDLSGTYPNPTVSKVENRDVEIAADIPSSLSDDFEDATTSNSQWKIIDSTVTVVAFPHSSWVESSGSLHKVTTGNSKDLSSATSFPFNDGDSIVIDQTGLQYNNATTIGLAQTTGGTPNEALKDQLYFQMFSGGTLRYVKYVGGAYNAQVDIVFTPQANWRYLKFERSGSNLIMSYSANGSSWTVGYTETSGFLFDANVFLRFSCGNDTLAINNVTATAGATLLANNAALFWNQSSLKFQTKTPLEQATFLSTYLQSLGIGIPSVTGNSGKVLTNNGTTASWGAATMGGDISGTSENARVEKIGNRMFQFPTAPTVVQDFFTNTYDTGLFTAFGNGAGTSIGYEYINGALRAYSSGTATTGKNTYFRVVTNNNYNFTDQTVEWGLEPTTLNDAAIQGSQGYLVMNLTQSPDFWGILSETGIGFAYRPTVSPTSIQLRYQASYVSSGNYRVDVTLPEAPKKFRLTDLGGVMFYYVYLPTYAGGGWYLAGQYDYTGTMPAAMKADLFAYSESSKTPALDSLITTLATTSDTLADKSLIWWNLAGNRFEPKPLSTVRQSLEAVNPTAPATATDTCTAGQTASDANYFYSCVATNTWKRAPLSTW